MLPFSTLKDSNVVERGNEGGGAARETRQSEYSHMIKTLFSRPAEEIETFFLQSDRPAREPSFVPTICGLSTENPTARGG
jgi:hypothetical protein